ncbi:hypothetical protein V6N13_124110 [Hibiscus sabdariffa]
MTMAIFSLFHFYGLLFQRCVCVFVCRQVLQSKNNICLSPGNLVRYGYVGWRRRRRGRRKGDEANVKPRHKVRAMARLKKPTTKYEAGGAWVGNGDDTVAIMVKL